MNWEQLFSLETLTPLLQPAGIGLGVIVVTMVLRHYIYRYFLKLTSKTKTCFDDIMIRDTRIISILWCIWMGVWVGWRMAEKSEVWEKTVNDSRAIPAFFAAMGICTAIVIITAIFKWYKAEICPRTKAGLDDIIMTVLIVGTPVVGIALGTILVLNILGYENASINVWMHQHLSNLALLVILAVILILLSILFVPKVIASFVRNASVEQTDEELQKRADTLTSVIVTTLQVLIIFIFGLMIVSQFVPAGTITPILTATGVVGVAIGFGAQSLVKDIIAGLFIILENQYRKGDVVKIADTSGVVEEINLRRTILRDMDGIYHVVPNGEIRVASNYTKQVSKVNLNVSVSYDTNLDQAMSVINRIGQEMASDPAWASSFISPPKALRVDNLGDSGVEIKIVAETKPMRQWDITGELRLRIKKAFDKEGIEIPWPHTKVYFGNQPPASLPKSSERIEDIKQPRKNI
jgi:small-conductance mechanosensitive channel